jgi:bifunctional non-homologous end joining protein LigD
MLAASATQLPCGPEWTYEVKWDGYRTLAVKEGRRVRLFSRNLKDATTQYPSVVQAVAQVHGDAALLDGEVVAVDAAGRPSFQALHHRSAAHIVYYAFDILHLDGQDLMRDPLDRRRATLSRVTEGTGVLRSEPLPGTPEQIERAVRELGLEGLIAKRRGSLYEPGRRSPSWVKVKFNHRQELVVGGFKPTAAGFESLLVGYYDEHSKLRFAGKVRAGLTPHMRAQIMARIAPGQTRTCPFVNLPSSRTGHWGEGMTAEDMMKLRWVKPKLVVEISFVEWTRDGLLRHPQFVGIREDKRPKDVVREDSAGLDR